VEVTESGSYFDPARVLWDERIDGPLPEITLGGMVRQGDTLVFDQAQMDADLLLKNPQTLAQHNAPILAELERLDMKLIHPLSEGDQARVASIIEQKVALRAQLKKE